MSPYEPYAAPDERQKDMTAVILGAARTGPPDGAGRARIELAGRGSSWQ